jgi:hypothetical protein
MTGPDFVMGHIVSWTERGGAASQLVLADGSRWQISPNRRDYLAQVTFVELAKRYDEELLDLLVGIDMVAKEVVAVRPLSEASVPARARDSGASR